MVFCSPMKAMTFSRLSIHWVSFESRKAHSSFSNFRWKDDFTSTLWFSWSMRPSITPSEIPRTTHLSTLSSLSSSALATSDSCISDLAWARDASVSSRILDMASWKLMPCSSKSLALAFWKSRRSLTDPEKKTWQSFTRSPCLVLASAFTVSKARMSSNWITEGSCTASLISSTVASVTVASPRVFADSPWKERWYLFRCWKASRRFPSALM
mmetsp:Transcript_43330/g.111893  ORF Transcript_43330/g.111893 Transcript_43330/m.111893 type:complete len:212 (+) Transcript_43330:199-834(+)